jgi:hypothetical protein
VHRLLDDRALPQHTAWLLLLMVLLKRLMLVIAAAL